MNTAGLSTNFCPDCFNTVSVREARCPSCGYNLRSDEEDEECLKPGTILKDRYVIGRKLGQGGFGITYKAYDQESGVVYAVKEYYPSALVKRNTSLGRKNVSLRSESCREQYQIGMDRFYREACILAAFKTEPGIVHIVKCFYQHGTVYYVMDYVSGIDFAQFLHKKGGRIRFSEAVDLLAPVMHTLDHVHKKSIIHRDISPDNIFVGLKNQMILLDFGAARDYAADNSSFSIILKPGFAPVEQYSKHGEQGPWTDIYAMAATIYYAVAGMVPPVSTERLQSAKGMEPIENFDRNMNAQEAAVMRKAMAVNAEQRYQSMGDFLSALRHARPVSKRDERRKNSSGSFSDSGSVWDHPSGFFRPLRLDLSDNNVMILAIIILIIIILVVIVLVTR